jgi:hypothetical protein
MPKYPSFGEPAAIRFEPLAQAPVPAIAPGPTASAPAIKLQSTTVRMKTEQPAGYTPPPRSYEARDMAAIPYVQRGTPETRSSSFPWKLVAAAVVLIVAGVGAGRAYLPRRSAKPTAAASAVPMVPLPAPEISTGSLTVDTQPSGARVLVDGAAAGETPLTLDDLAPGRHTLTFVTAAGTVKKIVRVEAGKTLTLDVPVYSGWVAVFAPIALDISENGRGIGSTEQGRLMLSPGKHELTLSNREFGYKAVRTVTVEPGEERPITVQPTGEVSLNALPWAEVWIDGQKTGETPIAHLQVPLGTHEILFKHPQFGERRMTVTVTATAPVAASADFTKQ